MSEHKFSYTVSGIKLSDEQQVRVSQAIAGAVASALAHEAPGEFSADSLTLHRIYGGIWQAVEIRGTEVNDPVANQVGVIAQWET